MKKLKPKLRNFSKFEPWMVRREYILKIIDERGEILADFPARGKNYVKYISWDKDCIAIKQKDLDKLVKQGILKKVPNFNKNYYVRKLKKDEEVVVELREPYKKRKLAMEEFVKANERKNLHFTKIVEQKI